MDPTFRRYKKILRAWLQEEDWTQSSPFPLELQNSREMEIINPLFACLPQGGILTDRAAYIIGKLVAQLFEKERELAQNCVRRFIWHMNEESGNIGWGIPQVFGQTLAQSAGLARIYHNILMSYVRDINADSTFCDHAPLRVFCYEALLIFGTGQPAFQERICSILAESKEDDEACLVKLKEVQAAFCR